MTEPRTLVGARCNIGTRFQIEDAERELTGRGGVGDVYQGTGLQTGQAVAIKALRPEVVSSDPNALARFLREGEALRQLNHPNIAGSCRCSPCARAFGINGTRCDR